MRDIRLRARESFHFFGRQMNTMGQHHVGARDSQAVEISNVSFAGFALDDLTFALVLGCMRVNHHAMLLCELRHFAQQFVRATDRKTWRETATNAAARLTMPFLNQ